MIFTAAAAPAANTLPFGDWKLQAQGCTGCTDTRPVGELAGSTIVISPTKYVDSVLGTDICLSAPILRVTRTGSLADVAGPEVEARIHGFPGVAAMSAPASEIEVGCSKPAKPPYTGKVLARLLYVPPSTLLYLWAEDVLLFTKPAS